MKGTKDITQSDRVSKEVSDDYTRFTVQKSQISDSGTYFVVARNDFGTDRIFVTITVRTFYYNQSLQTHMYLRCHVLFFCAVAVPECS